MTNKDLNSFSSAIGRAEMHVSFKVKYCHNIFFRKFQTCRGAAKKSLGRLKAGMVSGYMRLALTKTMCISMWTWV